jgi:hypothetical protein
MKEIDDGRQICPYDAHYWEAELAAARARAFGSALARVAEAVLYCRIPIERFIDIGTGPGYLLDSLSWVMPSSRALFHGVELFPPEPAWRTRHENYTIGSLASFSRPFQCGTCIEVVEHLTPRMLSSMARELAQVSAPGACYIFNTGLTDYVRLEDAGYVDPLRRGHISIWSATALGTVFAPHSFRVHPIPGKSWAVLVEYKYDSAPGSCAITDRIWTPCPENRKLLDDPETGSLMYVLGIDTARAYLV